MYFCHSSVLAPSSVSAVAKGYFLAGDQPNLLIAKRQVLELHRISNDTEDVLTIVHSMPPQARVLCLQTLPALNGNGTDMVFVLSSKLQWRIVQWSPKRNSFGVVACGDIPFPTTSSQFRKERVVVKHHIVGDGYKVFVAAWRSVLFAITATFTKGVVSTSQRQFDFGEYAQSPVLILDFDVLPSSVTARPGSRTDMALHRTSELAVLLWVQDGLERGPLAKFPPALPYGASVETVTLNHASAQIIPGAWKLLNVDPSTKNLFCSGPNVVLVSDSSATSYNSKGKLSEVRYEVLGFHALSSLDPVRTILQDGAGQLWLLEINPAGSRMSKIEVDAAVSWAESFVQLNDQTLLQASSLGNSQLLAVTQSPASMNLSVQDPLFVDNMGAILDMTVIDPYHSGQAQLVVCSGNPEIASGDVSSLRMCTWGVALTTVVDAGSILEGNPAVISTLDRVSSFRGADEYLMFSNEHSTQVLWVGGSSQEFVPAQISGFDEESSTLAAAVISPTVLMQVSEDGINIIHLAKALIANESFSSKLHLADICNSMILSSSGSTVYVHAADAGRASISQKFKVVLSQQVSALAFERPNTKLNDDTKPSYFAIGEWVQNVISIFSIEDMQQVVSEELPGVYARSLCMIDLSGGQKRWYAVIAGLADGRVIHYSFKPAKDSGSPILKQVQSLRVGNTPVTLKAFCLGKEYYVYCNSDRDAVLQIPSRISLPKDYDKEVELSCHAVHNQGKTVTAITPFNTETLPNAFAWVEDGGRLVFGTLDPKPKLNWASLPMPQTPLKAAFHPLTRCLIVIAKQAEKHMIKVILHSSLQEVCTIQLKPKHVATTLCIASLVPGGPQYVIVGSEVRQHLLAENNTALLSFYEFATEANVAAPSKKAWSISLCAVATFKGKCNAVLALEGLCQFLVVVDRDRLRVFEQKKTDADSDVQGEELQSEEICSAALECEGPSSCWGHHVVAAPFGGQVTLWRFDPKLRCLKELAKEKEKRMSTAVLVREGAEGVQVWAADTTQRVTVLAPAEYTTIVDDVPQVHTMLQPVAYFTTVDVVLHFGMGPGSDLVIYCGRGSVGVSNGVSKAVHTTLLKLQHTFDQTPSLLPSSSLFPREKSSPEPSSSSSSTTTPTEPPVPMLDGDYLRQFLTGLSDEEASEVAKKMSVPLPAIAEGLRGMERALGLSPAL